jgi:hypothetical protein
MSENADQWHSDDELASALEQSLQSTASIPVQKPAEFSDLFAALTEPQQSPSGAPETPAQDAVPVAPEIEVPAPVVAATQEQAVDGPREQVFESLDDFKPRTNFIPVVGAASTESLVQAPVSGTNTVPVTSAQVTQPIRWDRKRPSFDEIIFGTAPSTESN